MPENDREGIPKSYDRMAVLVIGDGGKKDGLARHVGSGRNAEVGGEVSRLDDSHAVSMPIAPSGQTVEFGESDCCWPRRAHIVADRAKSLLDNCVLRRAKCAAASLGPNSGPCAPLANPSSQKVSKVASRTWKKHVCTAISDVQDIHIKRRKRRRTCLLGPWSFGGGVEVPSWTLSDGILRLLALSIIAYVPEEGTNPLDRGTRERRSSAGCRGGLPLAFVCL